MRVLACAAAAVAIFIGSPAVASWNVAESKHFVIYANEAPSALNAYAAQLERFDQAARFLRLMDDPPVGLGNRLTVFILPSLSDVQALAGNRTVGGFYHAHASGSIAFVPRSAYENDEFGTSANTIFFHEYSHHLMFQANDKPLPGWVVEGFAEFMSTVQFDSDGAVEIGLPANHRAIGLSHGTVLPIESMLGGNYSQLSYQQEESLYGRGWLLVHYLVFNQARAGQLDRYVNQISKGVPALDAARSVFGDLKKLNNELDGYLQRGRMAFLKIPPSQFHAVNITVRPLTGGAAKVIMLRAQSKRGVDDKTAEPLAVQVRAVEKLYPGDELVELTLAEAEIDAGHPDASEAAADRTLKANPQNTKAMIFKGRAIAARSEKLEGAARHNGFEQARDLFLAANRIDTEDPEALSLFYDTFVMERVRPTANAIAALHYASELAPQVGELRMNSAMAYLNEGKLPEAKHALAPIAYDPHGGRMSKLARTIIEKIDAGDGKAALAAAFTTEPSETKSP
jgi:tetratricopeptide (TPR) repeat protein